MNLLYANDRKGQYPNSWYATTATPTARFATLKGVVKADVCVVGGGFAKVWWCRDRAGPTVGLWEARRQT